MKKTVCVLLVLCLCFSLFATMSFRLCGAYNFVTGSTGNIKITTPETSDEKNTFKGASYKTHGFGFDVAMDFDVSEKLVVWTDFNVVFGRDFKVKTDAELYILDMNDAYKDGDWYSMKLYYDEENLKGIKDLYKRFNTISVGAGVACRISLSPVDLKLGGGLFFDRAMGNVGNKSDGTESYIKFRAANFGVALYAGAEYKFGKGFGIGLTVMPHLGLYDSFLYRYYYKGGLAPAIEAKEKAGCLKFSYSMPVVLGMSYSF